MKSHEKQGLVHLFNPSTPLWHHESRSYREDFLGRIETQPTTAQVLLTCRVGEAVESITPWKRLGKQCRGVLREFLKPGPGIETIGEQPFMLVLTEG
jgi:hypothetical protein